MQSLAFKMLFRRKGTVSTILAIALLIALLASVNSLMNNVNSQTALLSQLAGAGRAYLISSADADSLTASRVDASLVAIVNGTADVSYVVPQMLVPAKLSCDSGNYDITLRGVESVRAFCDVKKASVKGSVAVNETQVNVGKILSQLASININDTLTLTVAGKTLNVKVCGIITSNTQSDSEIILPAKTVDVLCGERGAFSFIEFAPKNANVAGSVLDRLGERLPDNVKLSKVQQVDSFMLDVNGQVLSFLNLWSWVIYAVVIAASYVVANRLIAEASYELSMIKTLGARRRTLFGLVFTHTLAVAFVGAVLGLAIGIVGAQLASTGLRWFSSGLQVMPFLEVGQALQILGLALVFAVLGCLYPALKTAFKINVETDL